MKIDIVGMCERIKNWRWTTLYTVPGGCYHCGWVSSMGHPGKCGGCGALFRSPQELRPIDREMNQVMGGVRAYLEKQRRLYADKLILELSDA